jgi:predicted nucleic acid-binding protein
MSLIAKYNNIPMSLADACLVRMSEQISDSSICTLDNDFRIYRKEKRKLIPVIMPE